MSFEKCSARCIAFVNCLYIGTYFVKTITDFMENGLSEGSFVMWSSILLVNMISNMYLIVAVRKEVICTWFFLTFILFIIRLSMPYELHGTTYKTISIVINVYIVLSILFMISLYHELKNSWDEPTMLKQVTVSSAPEYKTRGTNVGNGVRLMKIPPTRTKPTHHYETDDYGVEGFNYTTIDLPTFNNILSNEDNCCADPREGGAGDYGDRNADCCADSGGGGGNYGGGDVDCCADSGEGGGGGGYDGGEGGYDGGHVDCCADIGGGGGSYDYGGGDYDCSGGGDCGGYDA